MDGFRLAHLIHKKKKKVASALPQLLCNATDRSLHLICVLVLQGESWFQMSKSGSDETESLSGQPSQILRERLSTLNQAAAAMARADVFKKDQMRKNRHPDYEFFLSRNR